MLADVFDLSGKVAIVTGSGRGIGRSIGLTFARAGAQVVFSARTEIEIDESANLAATVGPGAVAVPCDVTDDAQLQSLVTRTLQECGRIDIVVNNAGGAAPRPIAHIQTSEFLKDIHFNVVSAFSLTRMCLPYLRQTRGAVINISSRAGSLVAPNFTSYGTAKAALDFMTMAMAVELAPEVRVNAIAPGWILTEAQRKFLSPDQLAQVPRGIPMKQWGQVEDVAWAALYLASPAARWVTGKILEIDGGATSFTVPDAQPGM